MRLRRNERAASRLGLALLACLACLAGAGQAGGRSLLSQLAAGPLFGAGGELGELMRRAGELVETVRQSSGFAYEDLAGSLAGQRRRHAHNLIAGPGAGVGAEAQAQAQAQADECRLQPDGGYLCGPADPDAARNVTEIIRSRGFLAQEFDVTTADGYILTIQRIVNPLVEASQRARLKPVILQHGLMSSSVDWVINSVDVRPSSWPARASTGANCSGPLADSQRHPNSLGFYLANEGYDVFLANSRGNVYGQRHVNLSAWQPAFWDFTFDEQIQYDLPGVLAFVQRLTGHQKVGYVGHSQGTTMALGLLAERPQFADQLEPVVLLAPVAYVGNCLSPVKYFAIYTPIFQHINMWFASSNLAVRYLAPRVCGPKVIRRDVCENIIFLSTGFDEAQFNDTRASAYLAHMPSGTSVKNIAHWGQEVLSGRFAHFDRGLLANEARYGRARPPDYELARIRSKSLALFVADNDWLASPKDVARLRSELTVSPHEVFNVSELMPAWNHIDFLYGKDCGWLVNKRVVEIFHHFDDK